MTIENNKQLVRDVMAAITNKDWDFVENSFAEEAIVWVAGAMPISGTHGKEFVIASGERTQAFFPNGLKLTPKEMTAEGDRVAVEAETYGTHFSGKLYNNHFHFLFEIRGGKIHVWKEYMDTMHANDVFFGDAT